MPCPDKRNFGYFEANQGRYFGILAAASPGSRLSFGQSCFSTGNNAPNDAALPMSPPLTGPTLWLIVFFSCPKGGNAAPQSEGDY